MSMWEFTKKIVVTLIVAAIVGGVMGYFLLPIYAIPLTILCGAVLGYIATNRLIAIAKQKEK